MLLLLRSVLLLVVPSARWLLLLRIGGRVVRLLLLLLSLRVGRLLVPVLLLLLLLLLSLLLLLLLLMLLKQAERGVSGDALRMNPAGKDELERLLRVTKKGGKVELHWRRAMGLVSSARRRCERSRRRNEVVRSLPASSSALTNRSLLP